MWYYTVNNQPVGPVDEEKLKQLLASQSINANTLVWKEGMAEWKPLGTNRTCQAYRRSSHGATCSASICPKS